jgi:glutathione S-transferase
MSDEIVFYTHPMSRGRIARWMLEETGLPYRAEVLPYGVAMKTPEYLAINPMGKVPAIKHGDAVVTEGGAICAYLADLVPEKRLAPPVGSPARAAYYRWLFFGAGCIDPAMTNRALGFEISEERSRFLAYGTHDILLDVLEKAVSGDGYLAGPEFTAADVYAGGQLGFAIQFKLFEPRPAFAAYLNRIRNRPAAIRAGQLDDKAMEEQQEKAAS